MVVKKVVGVTRRPRENEKPLNAIAESACYGVTGYELGYDWNLTESRVSKMNKNSYIQSMKNFDSVNASNTFCWLNRLIDVRTVR